MRKTFEDIEPGAPKMARLLSFVKYISFHLLSSNKFLSRASGTLFIMRPGTRL